MAKNSKKKRGTSKSAAYVAYAGENRQEKNKIKKLTRHVKHNPEDEKAAADLKRILASGNTYKRRDNRSAVHKNSGLDNRLTAIATRKFRNGATMLDPRGKLVQKPERRIKRTKKLTLLEDLLTKRFGEVNWKRS